MNVRVATMTAALAMAALPAFGLEQSFERSLKVNGHVELSVSTGSGNIRITRGSGTEVHIVGHVKSGWGGNEQRVHEIVANPPIEQTGNIIRIGTHHENLHNISISYEIQAPENTLLEAGSGSGDIYDDGVGENAKLGTGSGNVHATGLQGAFALNTGSGDILAEQTGSGNVRAQTGSGNIELRGIRGGLRADTGSGNIKVNGTPSTDWRLETGSGDVELWPGNAGVTLDASTGSGNVHAEHEMAVQGSFDKHHIVGKINGGGPTIRIQTGSGNIQVH